MIPYEEELEASDGRGKKFILRHITWPVYSAADGKLENKCRVPRGALATKRVARAVRRPYIHAVVAPTKESQMADDEKRRVRPS
jgi:hypothetical protein